MTNQAVAYITFGLLLMTPGLARASDDVAVAGPGCTTATQYGKVMMQCADGTVSVMNNNTLYVCRADADTGATKCTEHGISKD